MPIKKALSFTTTLVLLGRFEHPMRVTISIFMVFSTLLQFCIAGVF